jgi:peptide-methionine (S)-S-oxide reductase
MKAYFAGGCFWCLEAVFQRVKGISRVTSGYAGGQVASPTYELVSRGTTGHAETVEVEFDPEKIGYNTLLEMFFTIHDPTTLNRQGNDVGEQYRSAIFFVNPEQQQQATEAIERLAASGAYPDPIVTEVRPLDRFFTAEQYHQNYFNVNQQQPYCQLIISPKIKKFEEKFGKFLES